MVASGNATEGKGDTTATAGPDGGPDDALHPCHTCLACTARLTRGRGVPAASPPASQCTSAGAREGRCVAPLPHLNLTLFIARLASTWTSHIDVPSSLSTALGHDYHWWTPPEVPAACVSNRNSGKLSRLLHSRFLLAESGSRRRPRRARVSQWLWSHKPLMMMGLAVRLCSNEDFAELARRCGAFAAPRPEHGRPSCKQMKIDTQTSRRAADAGRHHNPRILKSGRL